MFIELNYLPVVLVHWTELVEALPTSTLFHCAVPARQVRQRFCLNSVCYIQCENLGTTNGAGHV